MEKGKEEKKLRWETTRWIFGEKSTGKNCGRETGVWFRAVNRCRPVSCGGVCGAYKGKIEGFAAAPVEALYRGYQR